MFTTQSIRAITTLSKLLLALISTKHIYKECACLSAKEKLKNRLAGKINFYGV